MARSSLPPRRRRLRGHRAAAKSARTNIRSRPGQGKSQVHAKLGQQRRKVRFHLAILTARSVQHAVIGMCARLILVV